MLVLTRRMLESIQIGPDITIYIVDIDRGKVRIGISAPKDVVVVRTELLSGDVHVSPQTYKRIGAQPIPQERISDVRKQGESGHQKSDTGGEDHDGLKEV